MSGTLTLAPDDQQEKTAELRRMKARATLMLVVVAGVFVAMRVFTETKGFAGYVEAAAEAAMVGGLADWFAVTALFRHPLGLPIPHTAIIPKRKDQIGDSLGSFVQDNFLNGDLVVERLEGMGIASRVGGWLSDPANARKIGDQTHTALGGVTEMLRDEDIATGLEDAVVNRLNGIPLTPLVGRAIDIAVEGNHHQTAVDALLAGVENFMDENQGNLRARLYAESPWWVPEALDDRVFDRIVEGFSNIIRDVRRDPDHEVRGHVDQRARDIAVRLRDDPDFIARGEELKAELLAHPEVRAWFSSLWLNLKAGLLEAADDPESDLRTRMEAALVSAGERLREDPVLQAKIDGWLQSIARYAVDQSTGEVADLIGGTVARWDAEQTSTLIETQVGRDLQFIRINGTVVGGLAGIVIHAIGQLL